jgi:hypothetical protein
LNIGCRAGRWSRRGSGLKQIKRQGMRGIRQTGQQGQRRAGHNGGVREYLWLGWQGGKSAARSLTRRHESPHVLRDLMATAMQIHNVFRD